MALFSDRYDAGSRLAALLVDRGLVDPVVLGLPRGGVPVAREVASALAATLDVLVVRKLGVPWQREVGIGALAEDDEPWWDEPAVRDTGMTAADKESVVTAERAELARRVEVYRGGRPLRALTDRTVLVVDDGLARGVTARAALHRVRRERPQRLVLAVPVGAPDAVQSLSSECDEVVCLEQPWNLGSVGEHYANFEETSDAEVLALLGS